MTSIPTQADAAATDTFMTYTLGLTKIVTEAEAIRAGFAAMDHGNNPPPYPRHIKQYRNLHKTQLELQAERVAGFRDFVAEVKGGQLPGPEHMVNAPDGVIDGFWLAVNADS